MALFLLLFLDEKASFNHKTNGHEVSAKVVHFSLTIIIDKGKVLRK